MLLSQLGETAALCFLFPVSEALEDCAVTRARSGLRALLSLVPPTSFVRCDGDQVGQAIRLAVAGPGSLVGKYPPGNTGRTTIRLTETDHIRPTLNWPSGPVSRLADTRRLSTSRSSPLVFCEESLTRRRALDMRSDATCP